MAVAVLLFCFCGVISACVYLAVTVDPQPTAVYVVAPQPATMHIHYQQQQQPQQFAPPTQYVQSGVPPAYVPQSQPAQQKSYGTY